MSHLINLIVTLKNGYLAKKDFVISFYSRFLEEVVKVLKREKYVKDYQIIEKSNGKKIMKIFLVYEDGKPALTDVEIVSKPGRRIYTKVEDLKPVLGGLGVAILSTPKGIKTDKEARKENAGGEVLFKIW